MSRYSRSKGVVEAPKGEVTRQIFFPLTPAVLEFLDEHGVDDLYCTSNVVEVNVEDYLQLLPELEAEVLYLLCVKRKTQKDVAKLLETSQPTISYRYRRAIDKLSYLVVLNSASLDEIIATLPQLKDKERDILRELFYTANQELVGAKFGVRQSSVKWIFTKAKRYLQAAEQQDPPRWFRHYCLFLLLERNLRKRIFS